MNAGKTIPREGTPPAASGYGLEALERELADQGVDTAAGMAPRPVRIVAMLRQIGQCHHQQGQIRI